MKKKNFVFLLILMLTIVSTEVFGSYKNFKSKNKYRALPTAMDSVNSYNKSGTAAKMATVYIGTKEQKFKNELKIKRGVVHLPIIEFVQLLTVLEKNMIEIGEGGRDITVNMNKNSVKMFSDKNYAEINGEKVNMGGILFWEDGDFNVPAEFFVKAIGKGFDQIDKEEITIIKVFDKKRSELENYVNSKNISSRTSYMVWISKSNYRVTIFKGSKNNWKHVDSFECSLGSLGKPTIVGQFEYFSQEEKWDFGYYYVGPVMRFHGPYAMHSTLLKPNGKSFDHRLKMNISKGCVRLRPVDINWMVRTIPLKSRVFVTNE